MRDIKDLILEKAELIRELESAKNRVKKCEEMLEKNKEAIERGGKNE